MKEPVFDAHLHYMMKIPVRESVKVYRRMFEMDQVARANFLSLPQDVDYEDPHQNLKALYFKHVLAPDAYAFAGIEFDWEQPYECRSAEYLRQVKKYWAAGYDGIKLYAGKPMMREKAGIPLCDPAYDAFYAYAEEQKIPIIMHLADPKEYWKADSVPPYAAYYDELFEILRKFPRLRLTLAHWGFFSYDLPLAERFFSYPNTLLDTTPGCEQVEHMHEYGIDAWKGFIEKYADRILFGTDAENLPLPEGDLSEWKKNALLCNTFLRNFFETDAEHTCLTYRFRGIALPKRYRDMIYYQNALREYPQPRPIRLDYCLEKIREYRNTTAEGTLDAENLNCMEEDFLGKA